MAAPAFPSSANDDNPLKSSPTPSVTVAQVLAFAAFVVFVVLLLLGEKIVDTTEAEELQRLCIFLIAALLPSDALIRFGRSRFMSSQEQTDDQGEPATTKDGTGVQDLPAKMAVTTVGQVLGFATFVVICVASLIKDFGPDRFGLAAATASYLIAALLPSEAVVRFGRSLWLAKVPTSQVTADAVKKI